jgi:hypothetical protein
VAGHFAALVTTSMAALPLSRAMVSVGPPLSVKRPRYESSVGESSTLPVAPRPQVVSSSMLKPMSVIPPAQFPPGLLVDRWVVPTLAVPLLKIPPPELPHP